MTPLKAGQQGSHHTRANSSFNLTFQSTKIRDGNFIRWPQGLTNQGVINDQMKFNKFNQTQSNFLNYQPNPLPQVPVHAQRRGTRFVISSLKNSLDDYKTQGGLFLPKIVADLPSERAHQAHSSQGGSIDSGKLKIDYNNHIAPKILANHSLRQQSANSNKIGGGQFNHSTGSSELETDGGQVVLVHQGGLLQFLKKTPFIPNPSNLSTETKRSRMQRGFKMS